MSNRKRHSKITTEKAILDIVIITGGRYDMLKKCLDALQAQENAPAFDVYILDNNTDNKERLQNKALFEYPIVTDSKRVTQDLGFPAANNEAVRMGNAPLILLLNDDVELKPNAIKIAVDTMDDERIGALGAKLIFPDGSKSGPSGKVQHVGMGMDISGNIVHPLIGWSVDNPKCNVSREVLCVTGAFMMTRRVLWNKIGGLYEGYGLGTYEECDYQMALKTMGKITYINTAIQGTHYTGATLYKKQEQGKVRGYPLQQNKTIFRARWEQSGFFKWDDYLFY